MSQIKKAAAAATCSVMLIINIVLSHHTLRTNREGLALIGNAEGCRRTPYACPAGHITDGIGNTHHVHPGTRKTDEQIAHDWEQNIADAERCVNAQAAGKTLTDDTFSAVTSLTFNVGCPALSHSTLFALLRRGDIAQACNQFPRWSYAARHKMPGIYHRRLQERALCLKGLRT
ncbi:lysozyme [Escherichia coli]|uniref:lysozyme n=1 Tax=Escherichia coli TaxID=562 RepID=UPI00135E52CF|nr:lysozyme [Escherichia coli]MXF04492.1 lysozyme [Escherichia coli]